MIGNLNLKCNKYLIHITIPIIKPKHTVFVIGLVQNWDYYIQYITQSNMYEF